MFPLFLLFLHLGTASSDYIAKDPLFCQPGELFYKAASPYYLLYCIEPGNFNITGCLSQKKELVSFDGVTDLLDSENPHLGFRYQCTRKMGINGRPQVLLDYTGCIATDPSAFFQKGSDFVDPKSKLECSCSATEPFFECGTN